jgi:hypothetical protein
MTDKSVENTDIQLELLFGALCTSRRDSRVVDGALYRSISAKVTRMTGRCLTFSPAFELANLAELRRERVEEVNGLPRERRDVVVLLGSEVRVVVVLLPNMVRSRLIGIGGCEYEEGESN